MNNKKDKIDIRSLSLEALQQQFISMDEKGFRAKQVYEWLWEKSCISFDAMSNISKELRTKLDEKFVINDVKIHTSQVSADKTIKNSFILHDTHLIEGVLIPTTDRMTACVSSQVGCSLTCKFCATGYMERKRNLNPDEIYDQVVLIDKQARENYGIPLSNIVYMGMGEPLLNYANVMKSIERITSEDGLNMSPKRITVSTAGIAKMIRKLGDDQVKFNLALSLHAANDEKRNAIMPINEQNSLKALADALKYYYAKTKNAVTYEYIIFDGVNDNILDAMELARFCKHLPCKVNIIEYNPISMAAFVNAGEDKVEAFADYLRGQGINTNLRRSRGKDIDAACGQLAINETEKEVAKA
ncbi:MULTISPECIES: 23S rRNA (adenine(2503)-C(2))-methyltransferase RlmN [unclassified Mucilaginibacter]|uniref:23S rRNA (adenine(2503)-C(2))-methyltransferase RlmN n=1 Tax=unclassified Mucilaginibacter TaxID=2617802 RepID=UPI002AC98AE0|nr:MULTISPECIES: 23S rRNA (adenine(2503)-C(2))-methyltransferase RlmN [unclassified Mucilaginibacter]MEB0260461.1 23S rRNA (adenine(2503)-C(2))-methyltransferase RlmN [Mucilaginibacter sp. 10I4]MEB0280043.1 23S rRNA (adenine(2503)-C(2))-methyltransferase RlmN [Mucilaginibacter sp. 10B2]MEB0301319.1 23S rRNA (adenine(2503)-C(2))-methyltransferase RlmN [Mucilaginibacter sp. 5C4]WPX23615.1 23S rRNA (adenine(2503)-C(2))-methyltransferase RlmN [Mucilaginibacter sp. 5C4]